MVNKRKGACLNLAKCGEFTYLNVTQMQVHSRNKHYRAKW